MAASTYDRALQLVLKHEGGYVDHYADPGGATNLGITIGTLSSWLGRPATKAEVKALKVADVAPIYRRGYWDKVRGDDLPAGVDYAVFDAAVNSGPGRGAKWLQRAVLVPADGVIGPETLKAAAAADPAVTINRICDDRLNFLKALPTWKTFGKGWSSRVAGVRAEALKMAAAAKPPTHPAICPTCGQPWPDAA